MGKKYLILSFVLLSAFLVFPSTIFAQDINSITVSGYNYPRNRHALVNTSGGPPNTHQSSSNLYGKLNTSQNFGVGGVVGCSVEINNFKDYVSTGDLVNSDSINYDIFFAGASENQPLSEEEIEELAKYIESGGIVYIYGSGNPPPSDPIGLEFNPLFERLGLQSKFTEDRINPGIELQTQNTNDSLVSNGPFGKVTSLRYQTLRELENNDALSLVSRTGIDTYEWGLVYEKRVGKGYLVVTTSPLYVNGFMGDNDNVNYFLNLFALGCNDEWRSNAVVLDVPSFKQGLSPFDDDDPFWEDQIYDSGDSLDLDCDFDTPGIPDATIGECGCAMTSTAMVMKYHGIDFLGGLKINPSVLNTLLINSLDSELGQNVSGYSGGNVRWNSLSNLSAINHQRNTDFPKLDLPVREDYSYGRVVELIDSDIPIILKVNGGAHWVTVVGYDSDSERVIINDPAYPDPPIGKYTYLDEKYTPVVGNSMVIYTPTFSDFRYLEFVSSEDNLVITDSEGNSLTNLHHNFDENYINPALSNEQPTEGMHSWTVKLPSDGEYLVKATGPFTVYTSNTAGGLSAKYVEQDANERTYKVTYLNETAGTEVNIEEVLLQQTVEIKIDVKPFSIIVYKLLRIPLPVPVMIYSDKDFDATLIDESTLRLGALGTEDSFYRCQHKDLNLNRDRLKDKLCWFDARKMGIQNRTKILKLTGEAQNIVFFGTDKIKYH